MAFLCEVVCVCVLVCIVCCMTDSFFLSFALYMCVCAHAGVHVCEKVNERERQKKNV